MLCIIHNGQKIKITAVNFIFYKALNV